MARVQSSAFVIHHLPLYTQTVREHTHTHTDGYTMNYSGRISPRSFNSLISISSFSIFCLNEQGTSLPTTQDKSSTRSSTNKSNIPLVPIKRNRSEHPYNNYRNKRKCGSTTIIILNTLTGDLLISSKHLSQAQVKLNELCSLA